MWFTPPAGRCGNWKIAAVHRLNSQVTWCIGCHIQHRSTPSVVLQELLSFTAQDKKCEEILFWGSRVSRPISPRAPGVMLGGGRWSCQLTEAWCQLSSDTGELWSRVTLNIKKGAGGSLSQAPPSPAEMSRQQINNSSSHDRTSPRDSCRHRHSSSVYPESQTGSIQSVGHIVWFMSAPLTSQFERRKNMSVRFLSYYMWSSLGGKILDHSFGSTSFFVFVDEYNCAKTLF